MSASVAMLAVRIWWPVIALLAVLGAAGGYVAAKDAPYAAVTTIRVDTAGFGEVAQESIVETAQLLVDSNRTYAKVVGNTPGAIAEIRQRTRVDAIASSSVLEIVVSAQNPTQAEREVDALAEAAITVVRELAEEQFTASIDDGAVGIANGVLPDAVAEQARRDALGTAIAAQQDNALRLSGSLSRIGEVLPATREGVGIRLASIIGLIAGSVVGVAVTLFIGVGRRRIRSLRDVRTVAPALVDCDPLPTTEGIVRVAAECSRLSHPLVAVLGLRGVGASVHEVSGRLRTELYRDGSRPFRIDDVEVRYAGLGDDRPRFAHTATAVPRDSRQRARTHSGTAAATVLPALGMPNRAADLVAADADLILVTGEADERMLHQVASRADVVLLVGRRGRTRLAELANVVGELRPPVPPVVVLLDPLTRTAGRPEAVRGAEAPDPARLEPPVAEPVPPAIGPAATATVPLGPVLPATAHSNGSTNGNGRRPDLTRNGEADGTDHGPRPELDDPTTWIVLDRSTAADASPRTDPDGGQSVGAEPAAGPPHDDATGHVASGHVVAEPDVADGTAPSGADPDRTGEPEGAGEPERPGPDPTDDAAAAATGDELEPTGVGAEGELRPEAHASADG
ncbi:MAG: hypothetical protein ACT4RN_21130 [Pseudonocardia sp.]